MSELSQDQVQWNSLKKEMTNIKYLRTILKALVESFDCDMPIAQEMRGTVSVIYRASICGRYMNCLKVLS